MNAAWGVISVVALLALPAAAVACERPPNAAAMEAGLLDWINGERAKKGLAALRPSAAMQKAAQAHACDMAENGYFSHQRAGGPDLKARLKKAGYKLRLAVENIAKSGQGTAEAAAGIWRKSPEHWSNILNSGVKDVGLAVATDGSKVYYVFNAGKQ